MKSENLTELKEREEGYIVAISGNTHIKRRLLDLGFTMGTAVRVLNISPLKNSYLLEIHGYILALRKNAVNKIEVSRV